MVAKADEIWKVLVCARDAMETREALSHIAYLVAGDMTGCGSVETSLATLRRCTGAEIADAVKARIDDRFKSVALAVGDVSALETRQ